MLNQSKSDFITVHWCMFATHHCQLNRRRIRRTLTLAYLAFHSNHCTWSAQPIQAFNRPGRTLTDVLIMWLRSLVLICLVGQVCGSERQLKQKIIKPNQLNYFLTFIPQLVQFMSNDKLKI